MAIRPATEKDLPAIAAIHLAAWRAFYAGLIPDEVLEAATVEGRLENWQAWFAEPGFDVYVDFEPRDHGIRGFISLSPARPVPGLTAPDGFGELCHIYQVVPLVGSGLGRSLFSFAVDTLCAAGYAGMLLWTLENNARARRFYERRGMQCDGAVKEDAGWHGVGVREVRYRLPFAASGKVA